MSIAIRILEWAQGSLRRWAVLAVGLCIGCYLAYKIVRFLFAVLIVLVALFLSPDAPPAP